MRFSEIQEQLSIKDLSDTKSFDELASTGTKTPKTQSVDQLASKAMKTPKLKLKTAAQMAKETEFARLRKKSKKST